VKIFLIIVLILTLVFGYLVFSRGKQRKEYKDKINLITVENYVLIRDSPFADELSRYKIVRKKNELRFTTKDGYTLFFLKLDTVKTNKVKLIGLDGYGIRDKEFSKYTASLVRRIVEKNNEMSPSN